MTTVESMVRASTMLTATGRAIDINNPDPASICIDDIARALARSTRFGGHLGDHVETYSVAQHSILVSQFSPPDLALVGLLHDAAEAYLGDVIGPLRRLLPAYRELEARFNLAIGEAFGLRDRLLDLPPEVRLADARAMATEARDLLVDTPARRAVFSAEPLGVTIVPLGPWNARDAFLARFGRLGGI